MEKIISGKVREIYQINDQELVIVTTDRISAFDVIMPTPIPEKGIILNQLASFWFNYTKDIVKNHMISENLADMPTYFQKPEFEKRTILVKKLKMLPYEFIVRGYMFGSMWKSYQATHEFCNYTWEKDYQLAEKLDTPILTPSTKNNEGHDINVTVDDVRQDLGEELTNQIITTAINLYRRCAEYAATKGIIIADTKFEFGLDEKDQLVLADEILTPDSSRFWDAKSYQIGTSPASYDKQFLRDWLTENQLAGKEPAPIIPKDIVEKTSEKYHHCLEAILD